MNKIIIGKYGLTLEQINEEERTVERMFFHIKHSEHGDINNILPLLADKKEFLKKAQEDLKNG